MSLPPWVLLRLAPNPLLDEVVAELVGEDSDQVGGVALPEARHALLGSHLLNAICYSFIGPIQQPLPHQFGQSLQASPDQIEREPDRQGQSEGQQGLGLGDIEAAGLVHIEFWIA